MARPRAPVYKMEGAEPLKAELKQLREVCDTLAELTPAEVNSRLQDAIAAVEAGARATVKISRGSCPVGYGLDHNKKAIACDTAIAILRTIKQAKGW